MDAGELTAGDAVKLPRSRRKWTVVEVVGPYVRVKNGSGFETRRKKVALRDVTLWKAKA